MTHTITEITFSDTPVIDAATALDMARYYCEKIRHAIRTRSKSFYTKPVDVDFARSAARRAAHFAQLYRDFQIQDQMLPPYDGGEYESYGGI